MRKRAKKDDNHNEIAAAFKTLGWSWLDTHQLGDGAPDGIAGRAQINLLVEIKDGSKPPSKRRLTDDEREFHTLWRGPLVVIENVDAVIGVHNSIVSNLS